MTGVTRAEALLNEYQYGSVYEVRSPLSIVM